MKKFFSLYLALIISLALTACGGSSSDSGSDSAYKAGDKSAFTADGVTFNMVYVPNDLQSKSGTADDGTITTTDAYWIGETEVTYELYKKVYVWATGDADMSSAIDGTETAGSYTFAYVGKQGGSTSYSTILHPATAISWRDAVIFCNALTEWYNAQNGTSYDCVYLDANSTPIKSVDASTTITTDSGTEDNPNVNSDAKGFRLLTADEWEIAARYIDGDSWLYGDHVSGDTSGPCWVSTSGGTGLGQQVISTVYDDYSVNMNNSSNKTAEVKTKLPNQLGLYDMCGNVFEWCFDWDSSTGNTRHFRGGHYGASGNNLRVGLVTSKNPYFKSIQGGIRIAMSAAE